MSQNGIVNPANAQCIALLEQVLESAKTGAITSVAVIACGDHEFGASFAGPDAAKLNLGLDTVKATILNNVTASSAPKRESHIIQARRPAPHILKS